MDVSRLLNLTGTLVAVADGDVDEYGDPTEVTTETTVRYWVDRSDAKKLIIVTDIYEFHREFSDFIESKNGKLRGDKNPLTAKQLVDLAGELAKSCK